MEADTPKVSVIVPIYSVERYIRQCVESLCAQDYGNMELVFVDDGSPDNSVDILMEVLESHPEVRGKSLIIRQKNAGLPKARMTGLHFATGDFIIHVDSDDWVEPDYLSKLVGTALEEDADLVYCDFFKEHDRGKTGIALEREFSPSDGPGAVKAVNNGVIRAYMWNKLARRELYDIDNMIVPIRGYHEDIVFQTQIMYAAAKCVHLRKPLYHYRRRRSGSLTRVGLIRSRHHSAENMLHLYENLPKDRGPVATSGIYILLRAGWYCCITFWFKTLAAHPDVVDILANMKYVHGCRVPIAKQVYTKFCCKLIKLFS
ncbi:MAG: glycosyltransferase [Bacteroidales bacterium]|nr:glycosyltransferase [Bacteroidales bacterium]